MEKIMKKKQWLMVCVAIVLLASIVYGGVTVAAQPGDASDPLVSKSYVDTQVNQLKTLIASVTGAVSNANTNNTANTVPAPAVLTQEEQDAIVAETLAYVEAIYGEALLQALESGAAGGVNNSTNANAEFVAIRMDKGKTLIGYASTEIILRGGSAVAVSGENGLCDVTGGADITNGMGVKLNHLLIVPSSDGRGLTCTTESYLMVKGGYYIVD